VRSSNQSQPLALKTSSVAADDGSGTLTIPRPVETFEQLCDVFLPTLAARIWATCCWPARMRNRLKGEAAALAVGTRAPRLAAATRRGESAETVPEAVPVAPAPIPDEALASTSPGNQIRNWEAEQTRSPNLQRHFTHGGDPNMPKLRTFTLRKNPRTHRWDRHWHQTRVQ